MRRDEVNERGGCSVGCCFNNRRVSLETVLYVSDTGGRSGSLQHTADVVR